MNYTQIYTWDDLPRLYNTASQLVWQQPENAKQEEHLDIFLASSVKALLCRWRAQGLHLGRADLTQPLRASSSHRHEFYFLQFGEGWHWAPAPSRALSLPKAAMSQPIQSSKEWTAIVPPLRNSFGSLWWVFSFSVLKVKFPTNKLVKCSIFSAQLFWDKEKYQWPCPPHGLTSPCAFAYITADHRHA